MSFSYNVCSQIPESLEPYGDIAGLGVVLAFVISAWLTILVLVGYYVFAFDPDVDPFQRTSTTTLFSPNPLDVLITKHTTYLRVLKNFRGSLAEDAFHKCILALADAQLITGISILMSGYMSLKHERGLSAYHWKMVVSLAWFSSVTHLSALTFLRSYLAKHSSRRLGRLTLMLVLLVLLFVGFLPTGHFDFLASQVKHNPSSYDSSSYYYRRLGDGGDQIEYSRFIDLGQLKYPQDCDNDKISDYYFDHWLVELKDLTSLDAELLRNGTIGPKNCTSSGISIFKHEIPSDTINFYNTKYLRILKDIKPGQSKSEAEVAVLYESPAVCFFKRDMRRSSDAYVSMVSSLLLLVYGYVIRAAKTFEGSSNLISQRIQTGLDRLYETWTQKCTGFLHRRQSTWIIVPVLVILPVQASVYCTLRVLLHLYTSMFAEVFSVLVSAIWGTLSITSMKNLGETETLIAENEWTFGQIISIALLSSSLFPILELLYISCATGINQKGVGTPTSPVSIASIPFCRLEAHLVDCRMTLTDTSWPSNITSYIFPASY